MTTIEIKFSEGEETQKIFIPEVAGKSRIHLVFGKNCSTGTSKKKSSDHIETVMVDDKVWYSCKICQVRFQIWRIARNHVANYHLREKSYLCNICGKSFIEKCNYNTHMKCHKERPFQCENCPRKFATEEERRIHDEGQHAGRERKYQCGNCNKMFLQLSHLKQHVLIHADEKPYRCKFCNKGYARPDNCASHEKSHENDKIYTCNICSKKFQTEKYMQRHIDKQHNKNKNKIESVKKDQTGDQKTEAITIEGNKSRGSKNIKSEEIESALASISGSSENKVKDVNVKNQDTSFNDIVKESKDSSEQSCYQADNLNIAEIVDKGGSNSTPPENEKSKKAEDKPKKQPMLFRPRHQFICDTCGKVFKKKDSLQLHIYTHTGEKPFQCELCNAAFRQKHHLQRHMLRHSGQKNEICSVCGKAFARAEHLHQHLLRMHSVDGKASLLKHCQICGSMVQNLNKHIKQVHNLANSDKQLNRCPICHGTFRSLNKFNRHIMKGKHFREEEVDRTCPICLQQFNKKGLYTVKRHMINVHGKDGQVEPLACSSCGRQFIDEASLSKHACKGYVQKTPGPKRKRSATVVRAPKRTKQQRDLELDTSEEESDSGEEIEIEQDGFDVLDFI